MLLFAVDNACSEMMPATLSTIHLKCGVPGEVIDNSCLPRKSEIAGLSPTMALKFQRNKCFFSAHS